MMTVMMVIIIVTATVPRIGPSIRWSIIAIAVPVVAVAIVIAGCTTTTTTSAEGSSWSSRSRSGSRRVPVTVVIIRIARIECCWRSRGFIHWRLLCRFPRWCSSSSSRSLLYSGWMTRHNDSGWDDWFVHQRVLLLLILCQNSGSVVILSHLVNFGLLLLLFFSLLLLLLFVLFAFRGFSCDINK